MTIAFNSRKYVTLITPLFLWWGTACQTIPDSNIEILPDYVREAFQDCTGEGAGLLTIKDGSFLLNQSDVDWSLDPTLSEFYLEFFSPFGSSVHLIEIKSGQLQQTGKAEVRLKSLKVQDEFILFEGHRLPLRVGELPCVFKQNWPLHWLSRIEAQWIENGAVHLYFDSSKRSVHLTIQTNGQQCAKLVWGGFLGMWRQSASWCVMNNQGKKYSEFNFKSTQLEWEPVL